MADLLVNVDPTYLSFKDSYGLIVVNLEKAHYGCVKSSQFEYDNLSSKLKSLGFRQNAKHSCVFNKDFHHPSYYRSLCTSTI